MFTLDERLAMIEQSVAGLAGSASVRVVAFPGLAVDAAATLGADFIVKGLRTGGDFEIEQQMAHTNHAAAGVRTVYLPCKPELVFISSRFIREIAKYGGDVTAMVPSPGAGTSSQRASRDDHELRRRSVRRRRDDEFDDDEFDDSDAFVRDDATATSATPRRCCAGRSTSSPPRRRCRCRRRRASTATRSSSCSRRRSTACPTSCARRAG